jgi:hypothetical protein
MQKYFNFLNPKSNKHLAVFNTLEDFKRLIEKNKTKKREIEKSILIIKYSMIHVKSIKDAIQIFTSFLESFAVQTSQQTSLLNSSISLKKTFGEKKKPCRNTQYTISENSLSSRQDSLFIYDLKIINY